MSEEKQDIVERLREDLGSQYCDPETLAFVYFDLMAEAADEIEGLRREIDALGDIVNGLREQLRLRG